MRIQVNKLGLERRPPAVLDQFVNYASKKIGRENIKIKEEHEIKVQVCKQCGAELYGEWYYYTGSSVKLYLPFTSPDGLWDKRRSMEEKLDKQYRPISEEKEYDKTFVCPICGEETTLKSAYRAETVDDAFKKRYDDLRDSSNRDGESTAKEYSKQCDLPVAASEFSNISIIKNDTEHLKKYILSLIQMETDIMLLTKRLASLYGERSFAMIGVNRVNYAPVIEAKKKQETYQKKLDQASEEYQRCLNSENTCKSIKPKPADMPMPKQPAEPEYRKPGLFNKKKVLAENEAMTAKYNLDMEEYERKCKKRLAEIDRQNKAINGNYLVRVQEAEKKTQEAKEKLEQLRVAPKDFVPRAPVEACPEKAKMKMIAEETEKTEELLKKTYQTRNELYATDVIFGKYRNIVALSTFYEYLMAGRCTSLEGAAGAYNLYEAEIRANMIISKLSEIEKSLKKIEQTQYMIYSQLTEMNHSLEQMNGTMNAAYTAIADIQSNTKDMTQYMAHISKNSDVIAHTTAVTAYYSKINAELTDALGFMIALK